MMLQPPASSPPFDCTSATSPSARAGAAGNGSPARCDPALLAALGPVLCLYRVADTHVLAGFRHAATVQAMVRLDSDGPREALLFFDRLHQPCWRLYLLPDSDCLAWEQAVTSLPCAAAPVRPWPGDDGEWAPIRRVLRNPVWRACALRLHALPRSASPSPASPYRLATSEATLSAAGQGAAQRIVKADGAEPMLFATDHNKGKPDRLPDR